MTAVIRWQQKTDLKIMRYQAEQWGGALTVPGTPTPHRMELEQMLPGDALPHYGDFGGGYAFEFHPYAGGAHLKVVNEAGGPPHFYPEPLPVLEMGLPTTLEMQTDPNYTYRFIPLSVGCEIFYHDIRRGVGHFKVAACVDFRLQEKSVCQDRCLSRLACPVAPEHRYEPEQISYHYNHSLASIRHYYRR